MSFWSTHNADGAGCYYNNHIYLVVASSTILVGGGEEYLWCLLLFTVDSWAYFSWWKIFLVKANYLGDWSFDFSCMVEIEVDNVYN